MRRLAALDGLRGFAALVVLPYHVIFALDRSLMDRALYTPSASEATQPYDLWCKFWVTLLNGHAAVVLFFMLSGCVLIQSARGDLSRSHWLAALAAFLVRRVFRLMPALIVCVAVLWLLAPPLDVGRLFENVSLYASDVNGVTWTLRVEMLVAPLIFAAGVLTRYSKEIGSAAFLAFALAAVVFPSLVMGNAEVSRNICYFAFGIIVPTRIGSVVADVLRRVPFLALVFGFLFARRVVPVFELAILIQAIIGCAVLCRAYYSPPAFLSGGPAQFFGQLSYSFYLWNMLFVNLLVATGDRVPSWFSRYPIEAGLPISIAFGLATIPIAMMSERYLERPGIAAGRAASDWIVGRSRPAASAL